MVRQARAVATREQIVLSAAQAFGKSGFEGASLAEIMDHSQVSKGAIYFHFQSKEELAQAIIEQQHRISIAAIETVACLENSAIEQIVMLCHEMARQMIEDPVVGAGIRLTLELSAVNGPADPYVDWIEGCRVLIQHAQREGDIVGTVSPSSLARTVIASFTGIQMVSNVLSGRADLEEQIDVFWGFLLPSIMPAARGGRIGDICRARLLPYAS
ncbi:ScbR family autoregulator-binding transcription factor [Rhodococcus sp. OK302]|uniref:ScbR family autoregulator-binding transcription factor n=1 Tax=Rhodococcus sp. OK302 TaxID=1882769 RepID=UPI000B93CB7E|nr:ScbR family autoregulator-binding transcription factor [Rhodococcus sp. OK302]